jgi:hypothetical protein
VGSYCEINVGCANFCFEFIATDYYLCGILLKQLTMPKKIKPTGKEKSMLILHAVIFAIATAASLMLYDKGGDGHWVYPWPAWTVAAWALTLLGHYCIVYTSYEDPGYDTYRKQQGYDK